MGMTAKCPECKSRMNITNFFCVCKICGAVEKKEHLNVFDPVTGETIDLNKRRDERTRYQTKQIRSRRIYNDFI